MRICALFAGVAILVCAAGGQAIAQEVTKESVPGIRNLARLQTTVACAGAITPEAVADIKKMGFVSIVNLRLATEAGRRGREGRGGGESGGPQVLSRPLRRQARSEGRGRVPGCDHDAGRRAGLHPLRRRQSRGDDVADQAAGGRSLGGRSRGQGGDRARSDQRGTQDVRHRVRAGAQALGTRDVVPRSESNNEQDFEGSTE